MLVATGMGAFFQPEPWRPENFYIGGGVSQTTVTPVALALIVSAAICILVLPRRFLIVPILLCLLLVPMGNVVVVGGQHLMPARIVALVGWIRLACVKVFSREALFEDPWNSIDKAFFWSVICHAVAFSLLWRSSAALVNQFGVLWSALGMYFLIRALVRTEDDLARVVKVFVFVGVIVAVEMIYEQVKGQNLFGSFIGGISVFPEIREGRIRSQGPFGHAILAGTYGAILVPVFLAFWKSNRLKLIGTVGLIATCIMVFTSASSTPALAFFAAMFGLFAWPIRKTMRAIRWGIVIGLLTLQMFMHAPVWFIIERMDVIGASSGYHRAELVNLFITKFFDWWLIGTKDNANWGWSMFDTSNTYVAQGQSGGLLAFIFFLAIIVRSFSRIGNTRAAVEGRKKEEWLTWCIGASLFANVIAFFGICYWDQTEIAWFTLLAMISAYSANILNAQKTEPEPAEESALEPATKNLAAYDDIDEYDPVNTWLRPEPPASV